MVAMGELEPEVEACMPIEDLVEEVGILYNKISELESLHPSQEVNSLFSQLVSLCLRPCSSALDVEELDTHTQEMRSHLILLCSEAEGLLETHFSKLLGAFAHPLSHLPLFPYYSNYRKLALLEYQLLCSAYQPAPFMPSKLAFLGSGPLPLTSLVLAMHHLPFTHFDNFDMDPEANLLARELISSSGGHAGSYNQLAQRMAFHTCNVKKVKEGLAEYEVVFLAALVGLDKAAKKEMIEHLAKYMKEGATLVVRSAHAARAFLYPIVDEEMLEASAFEVLSVLHPSDEVVNSIIIARLKPSKLRQSSEEEEEEEENHHLY